MTVIAFDPGISTGVAIHTQDLIYPKDLHVESGHYLTVVIKQVTDLWSLVDHHQPEVMICENFAAGGLISTYGQQTLRLIGALELLCFRNQARFVLQFPSEIHNNPALMKRAKVLIAQTKKTPIVHEIDAMAHLLLYEDRLAAGVLDKIMAKRGQRQI